MQTIAVNTSKSYNIFVGHNILKSSGELIKEHSKYSKAVIVTDDNVSHLYSQTVIDSLEKSGISTSLFVFKNGEESKCHETLLSLYSFLSSDEITRSDLLVALGGGVVGDLTGFAAATYLRGIDFIQIPTTLLAQTDSSIGGKTAVDIDSGKNLVGAFKQPELVICDIDTLSSLSEDIYNDGMAEVIKYAMIKSPSLFRTLYKRKDDTQLENIITECINIKKNIVEYDEFDKGERMLLNFGHTIGHAIEKFYNYTGISHGKAVGIGMVIITDACEKAGMTKKGTAEMLRKCLIKYNLPTTYDNPLENILHYTLNDKKRDSKGINIIVCSDIGDSHIEKMSVDSFMKLMEGHNG